MSDDIARKTDVDEAELKKVAATAEAKQLRHRVDEYIAMVIGVGAVLLLWFLQYLGLY
jgi:putative heme degradation protein